MEIPDGGFYIKEEKFTTTFAHESMLGEFSQPLFPQTCVMNLGECINSLVLTKLNKQRTLSGEYWGDCINENERWQLPWLWCKPEADASWNLWNNLTKIHFQLDLETVLNVLYIFVQVLSGSRSDHELHFKTFFTIVRGRIPKKLLFWTMTHRPMEPHRPLVVRSVE